MALHDAIFSLSIHWPDGINFSRASLVAYRQGNMWLLWALTRTTWRSSAPKQKLSVSLQFYNFKPLLHILGENFVRDLQKLFRWTKRHNEPQERVIVTIWTGRFKGPQNEQRNDCVPRISKILTSLFFPSPRVPGPV